MNGTSLKAIRRTYSKHRCQIDISGEASGAGDEKMVDLHWLLKKPGVGRGSGCR